MDAIASKLQDIYTRIRVASAPASPACLIAVSKTQPAQSVEIAAAAGQLDFGENYVQEGVDKIAALKLLSPQFSKLVWHMIGPIQSNKTRLVAEHFDWVHTIDRLKIAQRLSEQRPSGLPPLQVLIQINIDGEASKSGVTPDQALALASAVAGLPNLRLRGLMCIPEKNSEHAFKRMADLQCDLQSALPNAGLEVLSMGMSHDFEQAIAYGATHVRVGSAIFGQRA